MSFFISAEPKKGLVRELFLPPTAFNPLGGQSSKQVALLSWTKNACREEHGSVYWNGLVLMTRYFHAYFSGWMHNHDWRKVIPVESSWEWVLWERELKLTDNSSEEESFIFPCEIWWSRSSKLKSVSGQIKYIEEIYFEPFKFSQWSIFPEYCQIKYWPVLCICCKLFPHSFKSFIRRHSEKLIQFDSVLSSCTVNLVFVSFSQLFDQVSSLGKIVIYLAVFNVIDCLFPGSSLTYNFSFVHLSGIIIPRPDLSQNILPLTLGLPGSAS